MSVLLPKNFPDMLLRIQLRAVARKAVQFHLVSRILHEVFHGFTFVIGRAINNQDQIALGRATKRHQESAESLLREIVQLNTIAKQSRSGDRTKSLDSIMATVSPVLWRVR